MPEEQKEHITVGKAPRYVRELLEKPEMTIAIANAHEAVETLLLESQRNICSSSLPREELPAAIAAIDHMLKHLRLFKLQGDLDLRHRNEHQ